MPQTLSRSSANTVKKHVAAIHISAKLSLIARKLSNALLSNAYETITTSQSHVIDMRSIKNLINYNSNDVEPIKEALEQLVAARIKWDIMLDDGDHEWGVSTYLSFAKIRGGLCTYAYSPEIARRLYDPAKFDLVNLRIQGRFSSTYALALYENCHRYRFVKSTGWWPLDTLRDLLGVADNKYLSQFYRLREKVLDPAVLEINEYSDLKLTLQTEKVGRKVDKIRFLIRKQSTNTGLVKSGPGPSTTDDTNEWRRPTPGQNSLFKRRPPSRADVLQTRAAEFRQLQEKQNKVEHAFRQACLELIECLEEEIGPLEAGQLRKTFAGKLEPGFVRRDFDAKGWRSLANWPAIHIYWLNLHPDRLPAIAGFARDAGIDDWLHFKRDLANIERSL